LTKEDEEDIENVRGNIIVYSEITLTKEDEEDIENVRNEDILNVE
jgi:hypothetical protein